jgi:hypothetical protein
MQRIGTHQDVRRPTERGSWEERNPLALCDAGDCHWKHSGVDLEITQRKAEEHASDSGHEVSVYRELRRTVALRQEEPS